MSDNQRPADMCQSCWDGDHSNHQASWGGICVGCSCEGD